MNKMVCCFEFSRVPTMRDWRERHDNVVQVQSKVAV